MEPGTPSGSFFDMNAETPHPTFEDFRHENGRCYWWASDLLAMLGYESVQGGKSALSKARAACENIGQETDDHFVRVERVDDLFRGIDYKLSRFACYMVAINADSKKPQVAHAQAYFAHQTRQFEIYVEAQNAIPRIEHRAELTERNKSLQSAAKGAGVERYDFFMNAGYVGMYNMYNVNLEERRGVEHGKLMDHMGKAELAANIFRSAMAEERLKNEGVRGQWAAENVHREVGRQVRQVYIENTGHNPEDAPVESPIPKEKSALKRLSREMDKFDKPTPPRNKQKPGPEAST